MLLKDILGFVDMFFYTNCVFKTYFVQFNLFILFSIKLSLFNGDGMGQIFPQSAAPHFHTRGRTHVLFLLFSSFKHTLPYGVFKIDMKQTLKGH